jgi:hypothetical protein
MIHKGGAYREKKTCATANSYAVFGFLQLWRNFFFMRILLPNEVYGKFVCRRLFLSRKKIVTSKFFEASISYALRTLTVWRKTMIVSYRTLTSLYQGARMLKRKLLAALEQFWRPIGETHSVPRTRTTTWISQPYYCCCILYRCGCFVQWSLVLAIVSLLDPLSVPLRTI